MAGPKAGYVDVAYSASFTHEGQLTARLNKSRAGAHPKSGCATREDFISEALDLALHVLPVLLAQVLLQHLADWAARQCGDEVHTLRRLD
jgi:hypothetical protein